MARKRWYFGIVNPCTLRVDDGYEEPGYHDKDGRYFPPKVRGPLSVVFNSYSGTTVVRDERTANAIKALSRFRTEDNPGGDVWLIKEVVESDGESKPIVAPAPPKKAGPVVGVGVKGTGDSVKNVRKSVPRPKKAVPNG